MAIFKNNIVELYDSIARNHIQVSPSGDSPDILTVKASDDYWGKMDFSMDVETAEVLANAILEQCKYLKEQK